MSSSVSNLSATANLETNHLDTSWQAAKKLYDSQNYSGALEVFSTEMGPTPGAFFSGSDSLKYKAAYHYNLGVINFRLDKQGASLAHFEEANQIYPHDSDIQYNLKLVKQSLSKRIGHELLDPASSWVERLSEKYTSNDIHTLTGFTGLILAVAWLGFYAKEKSFKKAITHSGSLFAFTATLFAICLNVIHFWGVQYPAAISLHRQSVRSGPGNQYIELYRIEEGSKVRLLGPTAPETQPKSHNEHSDQTEAIWRQIRFSSTGVGWVKDSNLMAISSS